MSLYIVSCVRSTPRPSAGHHELGCAQSAPFSDNYWGPLNWKSSLFFRPESLISLAGILIVVVVIVIVVVVVIVIGPLAKVSLRYVRFSVDIAISVFLYKALRPYKHTGIFVRSILQSSLKLTFFCLFKQLFYKYKHISFDGKRSKQPERPPVTV